MAGLDEPSDRRNLDAVRDWGDAKDYGRAMWMMMQQDAQTDYVIGTREPHTVPEFCEAAVTHVGLDCGPFARIDRAYCQPTELEHLHGHPTKAKGELGWEPEISFEQLVQGIIEHDLLVEVGLGIDQAHEKATGLRHGGAR